MVDIKDSVDPKHYKSYFVDEDNEVGWVETMAKTRFRDPKKLCAGAELLMRKYIDREGQKDLSLQELKKARFYLQLWIEVLEQGSIDSDFSKDIHSFFDILDRRHNLTVHDICNFKIFLSESV